ncbi:MAG: competence/damage-inducible protein A [bacterium]|nr:competence/damage-inducible protein A [bacterium]
MTENTTNRASPTAALLLIGDELLSGQVQDVNLHFIANKLFSKGINLQEVRVVPDEENPIIKAVNELRDRYTYLFTTGGIGPTHDDITAATLAQIFKVPLELNLDAAKSFCTDVPQGLTPDQTRMATLPKGCRLVFCPETRAPGFALENVYCLAGYPHICHSMFEGLLPSLEKGAKIHKEEILCRLAEGHIAPRLQDIQNSFPEVAIGSYPRYKAPHRELLLIAKGTNKELVDEVIQEIRTLVTTVEKEKSA